MILGNYSHNKHKFTYPEFVKQKCLRKRERNRVDQVKRDLVKLFTEIFDERNPKAEG